MKILLALAITYLLVMPRVEAAPINNSTELAPQMQAATEQVNEQPTDMQESEPEPQKPVGPEQTPTPTSPVVEGSPINCVAPATAKEFIYCKESSNNPAAVNHIGCRGLGQACPGSKLPCGDNDYQCQDEWFTNYMLERYGSWEAAQAFWLARVPINGQDVGHWW
jgi:hypothetical protein